VDNFREFISQVRTGGLARSNKFAVEVTLPRGMTTNFGFTYQMRNILLFCDSTVLPGVSVATTPNRSFGETRESPYERLFDNIQLSFYVDNSMVVKSLFDEWSNLIQNYKSREFSYYEDYITKIAVTVFDTKSFPRYRVELFEAFPKNVGSISLNYSAKDIMKLDVNFTFKYWETIEVAPQLRYIQRTDTVSSNVISPTYLNDFANYQQQYQALSNPFENGRGTLFGDSQGIFTGTSGRGIS